jgi:hypothetical protein
MKVFISWSGSRSRIVAEALRSWLPNVLQALDPWLSFADIAAGSRWHQELGARLSSSSFGIICLTPENQGNNWLLYEAGALSKSMESARVVPYLIGLRQADLDGPLSYFQAVESEKEGTFELLRSLNSALDASGEIALSDTGLRRTHELWWPEIEVSLHNALRMPSDAVEKEQRDAGAQLFNNLLQVVSDYRIVLDKLHASQQAKPVTQEEGAHE